MYTAQENLKYIMSDRSKRRRGKFMCVYIFNAYHVKRRTIMDVLYIYTHIYINAYHVKRRTIMDGEHARSRRRRRQ